MNESLELYRKIKEMDTVCSTWYDKLVSDSVDTVVRQGFVDPKCYVLQYNTELNKYRTTILELEAAELQDPIRNKGLYKWLKNIDKVLDRPSLAISMVAEGTRIINGEKKNTLLISFENHVMSFKTIYNLEKRREIGPGGVDVFKIMSMEMDKEHMFLRGGVEMEKFTHILRPNLFDKTDVSIYN